jgi:hypothetical protein
MLGLGCAEDAERRDDCDADIQNQRKIGQAVKRLPDLRALLRGVSVGVVALRVLLKQRRMRSRED